MSNSNTDKSKPASTPAPAAATPAPAAATPTPAKPPTVNTTPVSTESVPDEDDKIQYFVIVGKVQTFPDVREAEKFLNSPDAPECTVIFGKISLVNEWHITSGSFQAFKSLVKAQKFLKQPGAPKDFVMVRGRITVPEIRVSLRG